MAMRGVGGVGGADKEADGERERESGVMGGAVAELSAGLDCWLAGLLGGASV